MKDAGTETGRAALAAAGRELRRQALAQPWSPMSFQAPSDELRRDVPVTQELTIRLQLTYTLAAPTPGSCPFWICSLSDRAGRVLSEEWRDACLEAVFTKAERARLFPIASPIYPRIVARFACVLDSGGGA